MFELGLDLWGSLLLNYNHRLGFAGLLRGDLEIDLWGLAIVFGTHASFSYFLVPTGSSCSTISFLWNSLLHIFRYRSLNSGELRP